MSSGELRVWKRDDAADLRGWEREESVIRRAHWEGVIILLSGPCFSPASQGTCVSSVGYRLEGGGKSRRLCELLEQDP